MRDEALKFLAAREEKVKLGQLEVTVREMQSAADVSALSEDGDSAWKMVVYSTFDADNQPLFKLEDIPALKATARTRMKPLVDAVMRVNGFDSEYEAKKSEAAPAAA